MEIADSTRSEANDGLRFMLRALRFRNYRLFFVGQGISLIGTWLTTTATSWLVLQLAQKQAGISTAENVAMVLGEVRFAAQVPMSVLTPAAGVLVDRWNRHHVLVVTQILSLIQSAALAILTFTHLINVPQLIGLSLFQGLVNAFDAPARQAFVVELVETRDDLANAIALNSSMFNGARLLGPAVAGVLIAYVGEAMCFTIDAISYLAVIVALLLMRLTRPETLTRPHGVLRELREGLSYAIGFAPVRALLLLAALMSLTVGAYQTLMPIFAQRAATTSNGALVFGLMGGAVGVGVVLAGAIYLASRRTVVGLGRVIAVTAALGGASMTLFAATNNLPLMLVTSVVAGFGMIVTFASSNTLLQTIVEDDMRARLMSFFILAVMGAAPLGSLLAGWVADRIGDQKTVMLSGIISIAGAGLFMLKLPVLRAMVQPIYIKRGILPDVASGLAAAQRVNVVEET